VRVCRVQRAAAEGCGIPEISDKARAYENKAGLEPGDWMERFKEFSAWLDK
jgi:hypothetical protein